MKTIGFIGVYDKMDFIIYLAKVLTSLGKKVLVVDNTFMQKSRYIIPAINPTKAYVTEFQKIDISIGFNNFEEIKNYLGIEPQNNLDYDIALVDIDSIDNFNNFNIKESEYKYFVTSFDLYSLKKGLEILNDITEPVQLIKILFTKDILKEENDYINYLTLGKKVIWNDDYIIYFPIDNGDQSVIIENQRVERIAIRKLSSHYKESLSYVVDSILGNEISSRRNKESI